jgi:hypothetical protein
MRKDQEENRNPLRSPSKEREIERKFKLRNLKIKISSRVTMAINKIV